MMDRHSLVFWSFPVAWLFGTEVRISWMLPVLGLIYTVLLGWQLGLALLVMVLLAVLLHEFGHVYGARVTGGTAEEIILSPLGGLAMVQAGPGVTAQFLTAAAGPLVNLAICGALFPSFYAPELVWRALNPTELPIQRLTSDHLVAELCLLGFSASYMLLMINLLPVFPFDGGQMLRVVLASRLPAEKVFQGMVFAGFFAAVTLMVAGLLLKLPGLILLGAIVLAVNILQSTQFGHGDAPDESFMGYDFSQGYTSLERSSGGADSEPRQSRWQRWKEEKKALRERQALERQQQDEAQLDALLAKVHEQGYESLTGPEKRLLQRVSTEYRQRPKRPS